MTSPGFDRHRGPQHLVVGHAGLDRAPGLRRRGRRPAGRPGPAVPRPARPPGSGAASSSWSNSRNATTDASGDLVQRRLGADDDPRDRARPRPRVAPGELGDRLAQQRLELLAGPVDADPQPLGQHRPAAVRGTPPAASCRTGGTPACRVVGLEHRRLAHLALGEGPARPARQQSGAPGPVQHAHHPTVAAQRRGRATPSTGRSGRCRRRGDRSPRRAASRPAPAPRSTRDQRRSRHRLEARARRRHDGRHPSAPGPLERHVAGVPRRRPLVLQRLVVLVDHHERRPASAWARTPRPGRRPPTHPPAAACAQSRGKRRHRAPAAPQPRGHARRPSPPTGTRSARRPRAAAASATGTTSTAGGSRSTVRGRSNASRTRRHRASTLAGPTAGARAGARTIAGGDAVARNVASRPTHRHAAHRHRSIMSADGPMPDTLAIGASATPGGRLDVDARVTHPPTRRPAAGSAPSSRPRPRSAHRSGTE